MDWLSQLLVGAALESHTEQRITDLHTGYQNRERGHLLSLTGCLSPFWLSEHPEELDNVSLSRKRKHCLYQKLRQEQQNHWEEWLGRKERGLFASPSSDKLVMGPDSWNSTMSSTLAPSNCWLTSSSSHCSPGWPAAAFDAVANELIFPRGAGSRAAFSLSCLSIVLHI